MAKKSRCRPRSVTKRRSVGSSSVSDGAAGLRALLRVPAFVEAYPELGSAAAWRWRIFMGTVNGLESAGGIVRVGRAVFLDAEGVERWLRGGGVRGQA